MLFRGADMDWSAAIDGYCERTDPSFWSEPLNALTNLAFVVAAAVMWRRTRGTRTGVQAVLILLLFAIGVGSGLFHTFATRWAGVADVAPIALFILAYLFAANRDLWRMPLWAAALGTAAFLPYAAAAGGAFAALPFFAVSAAYWPVALLIAVYGLLLLRGAPRTGRGMLIGAALLTASLVARSLDGALCAAVPLGTHWLWHLLNGVLLGWMIEVHRRHLAALEGPAARTVTGAVRSPGGPMSIDIPTARRVAALARIRVEEEALPALAEDFNRILGFVEQLEEVDVEGTPPMTGVTPMRLKRREDVVTTGDMADRILANAPLAREGFFAVPKVVE